jgi:hypothetical protein
LLTGGVRKIASCDKPLLSLIHGVVDEQKWARLIFDPASFGFEEFEYLVDEVFRDRLSPSDCWDLMLVRVEARQASEPGLENGVLCALMRNDEPEYERLKCLLERRNALQFEVITGGLE